MVSLYRGILQCFGPTLYFQFFAKVIISLKISHHCLEVTNFYKIPERTQFIKISAIFCSFALDIKKDLKNWTMVSIFSNFWRGG